MSGSGSCQSTRKLLTDSKVAMVHHKHKKTHRWSMRTRTKMILIAIRLLRICAGQNLI